MIKLSFCQNYPPIGGSFWQKDSLSTNIHNGWGFCFRLQELGYIAKIRLKWTWFSKAPLQSVMPGTLLFLLIKWPFFIKASLLLNFFVTKFWIFWTYEIQNGIRKKFNNEKWSFHHTVKSRAVDRSTIQRSYAKGQRSQYISIKFPLHKEPENPRACY